MNGFDMPGHITPSSMIFVHCSQHKLSHTLMAITDAGEGPTDDIVPSSVDFKGRPSVRSKSGCWKSASFIAGFYTAERFCYTGIGLNMVSYLTDELGQSTAAAAANLNAWFGTAALSPIFGALLADSFLGQFRTIAFSSLLYILGLIFLTLSAALNSSSSSSCNNTKCYPSQLQTNFFFFSLYIIAFAQGGHNPCLQAFGAGQFDVGDERECAAKSSFFNWFLWFLCLGTVLSLSVLTYIQENLSWVIGFGIPCLIMCCSLLVFCIGFSTYRFSIDKKNVRHPFLRMIKNKRPLSHHEPAADFEPLNKALVASEDEDAEEAKAMLKLVPIWCTTLGYSIVYSQPSTLFTKQAATIDRHIGNAFEIPAASLQLIIPLSVMLFVSIYDWAFVPIARSITKRPSGITTLQRVGIGLTLSLLSIMAAAVVEAKRLAVAREQGLVDLPTVMIPMSVWWLAPQYTLSGISDVFGIVGLQEFFYDQVPSELKSTGVALFHSILGVGNLLSSLLVSVIQNATSGDGGRGWFSDNLNRAHLDYFYWLLAGFSAVSLAVYVYFAKTYVYRSGAAV